MKKNYELSGIFVVIFCLAMLQSAALGGPVSYMERTCHNFISDQLMAICINGVNNLPTYDPAPPSLSRGVEIYSTNGVAIKPSLLKVCCYKKCSYSTYKQFCKPFPDPVFDGSNDNNQNNE